MTARDRRSAAEHRAYRGAPATASVRLRVDPIACTGRGLCAELLPGLVTLDDWGFPIIRDGDVPESLHRDAEEAVGVCPRLALRLERRAVGRPAGRGGTIDPGQAVQGDKMGKASSLSAGG